MAHEQKPERKTDKKIPPRPQPNDPEGKRQLSQGHERPPAHVERPKPRKQKQRVSTGEKVTIQAEVVPQEVQRAEPPRHTGGREVSLSDGKPKALSPGKTPAHKHTKEEREKVNTQKEMEAKVKTKVIPEELPLAEARIAEPTVLTLKPERKEGEEAQTTAVVISEKTGEATVTMQQVRQKNDG